MLTIGKNAFSGKAELLADSSYCLYAVHGDDAAAKLLQAIGRRYLAGHAEKGPDGFGYIMGTREEWAAAAELTLAVYRKRALPRLRACGYIDVAHWKRPGTDLRTTRMRLRPGRLPDPPAGEIDARALAAAAPWRHLMLPTGKKPRKASPPPAPHPAPIESTAKPKKPKRGKAIIEVDTTLVEIPKRRRRGFSYERLRQAERQRASARLRYRLAAMLDRAKTSTDLGEVADGLSYHLMFRVKRPDLSPADRELLNLAIYEDTATFEAWLRSHPNTRFPLDRRPPKKRKKRKKPKPAAQPTTMTWRGDYPPSFAWLTGELRKKAAAMGLVSAAS